MRKTANSVIKDFSCGWLRSLSAGAAFSFLQFCGKELIALLLKVSPEWLVVVLLCVRVTEKNSV